MDSIVLRPIWHIDVLFAKSNSYSLDGYYVRQVLEYPYACFIHVAKTKD